MQSCSELLCTSVQLLPFLAVWSAGGGAPVANLLTLTSGTEVLARQLSKLLLATADLLKYCYMGCILQQCLQDPPRLAALLLLAAWVSSAQYRVEL